MRQTLPKRKYIKIIYPIHLNEIQFLLHNIFFYTQVQLFKYVHIFIQSWPLATAYSVIAKYLTFIFYRKTNLVFSPRKQRKCYNTRYLVFTFWPIKDTRCSLIFLMQKYSCSAWFFFWLFGLIFISGNANRKGSINGKIYFPVDSLTFKNNIRLVVMIRWRWLNLSS